MDVFDITLESINTNISALKTISNNVANINTPGYLKSTSFAQTLSNTTTVKEMLSAKQGAIKETSRNLDIAILGEGFFQINHKNNMYLSKDGHFHISSDGYLRHSSGGFVFGENGPIVAQANSTQIKANGDVLVQGVTVDKIKLAQVSDIENLSRVGDNLYQTPFGFSQLSNVSLKSGALNGSNVEASEEMIKMIEVSRYLQTSQKVVQAYDQLLNVGINELGKK